MEKYLCVDVGGTSVKFGIYNEKGQLIHKLKSAPTNVTEKNNDIEESVMSVVREWRYEITGVAISSAGIVNTNKGKIIYSGYTIPGYTNTDWKKIIKNETGLNCEVENDVNAATLGEKWLGALQNITNGICLTIGTGIGGSILLDGEIYHGRNYTAGEIGYMDIGKDNFQNLASTSSLISRVENRTGKLLNGREIFHQAISGDKICEEEILQMVRYLSKGLLNIVYLFNPDKIVLGGGVMAQKEYLEPLIQEELEKQVQDPFFLSTDIAFAELGNDAGLLGALYHYLQKRS